MKLLAIDTSGPLCSAALGVDDRLLQRSEWAPRRHAELILPMMDALLQEAGIGLGELDALAYGHGPGSFTGVRMAAAVAQGAAFGAGLPVIGVSTLAGLAQGAWRATGARQVLCAQDARMGEVYWGAYALDANGLMQPCVADALDAPQSMRLPFAGGWHVAGTAWEQYPDVIAALDPGLMRLAVEHCEAQDLAVLALDRVRRGEGRAPQEAQPVYLRERVAEPPRR